MATLNLTDLQIVPSTDPMNPASAGWFVGTVYGTGSGRFKISVDGTYYPTDYPFPDPIYTQTQFYQKLTSGSHKICINTIAMSDEICRTVSFTPPTYSFTLNASKTSVVKGDSVTFTGTYKSSAKVVIYDVYYGKITETTCNDLGYFMVSVNLNVPEGSRQFKALSTDLLPKESNTVYITVTAPTTATHLECQSNICTKVSGYGPNECTPEGSSCGTSPTSATHALQFSLSPLSWANYTGLSNYLPSITTAFAEAITLYGWIGWTVVETRIEGNNLVIYLRETATAGHMSTLALPTVAAISAAVVFIIGIALRFGYLIIAYKLIELATGIVKVEQTKSESEQLRIKTITDLCNEGKLTPEQCNELLEKSKPGTGLCRLLGLDDQVCTDLKYIGIGLGALIIGYTIYKVLPKNK